MPPFAQINSRSIFAATPLPVAPTTGDLRVASSARLLAIRTTALPILRARRAFIERTWRAEDGDCVLLWSDSKVAFLCDPAGAERLSATIAQEEALAREEAALHDLLVALDDYDVGGRALRAELGLAQTRPAACFTELRAPEQPSQREYLRQLRTYERSVARELRNAPKAGSLRCAFG